MTTPENILSLYDYELPTHLIARSPAHPRDSAKLLVYNRATNEISFDVFRNIIKFLPPNAVLVFNQTKVIPARLQLTKTSGGAVEALYLGTEQNLLKVMASGKIAAGDTLNWEAGQSCTVRERNGKYALLEPSFPLGEFHTLMERYGETPLPPYIKNSPLSEAQRRSEYQTVYAKEEGSVAAPTAGLHFTNELIEQLQTHGFETAYVTLHVNLGTFAPVTEEHLRQKKLHEEYYEIDADTAAKLNQAKAEGRPIIAVGTTSVRTLESATVDKQLRTLNGVTDIFLTEDNTLQFVDGLITNFHVPQSSLLMLVASLVGREKLLDLYKQAIAQEFRFFSFGDAMLIV